jgi:uncharacterized protein YndB with AHSA1/START domain
VTRVTRARTVAAPPEAVWVLVRDPRALPQWWPRTERVEGVRGDAWTTVLRSPRGRVVRADWRLDASEKAVRRAWSQRVEGTPFEKVLRARRVELRLEPAERGTRVVAAIELEPRRRAGGLLLRGAIRRELDGALAGLARELSAAPPPGPEVPR